MLTTSDVITQIFQKPQLQINNQHVDELEMHQTASLGRVTKSQGH